MPLGRFSWAFPYDMKTVPDDRKNQQESRFHVLRSDWVGRENRPRVPSNRDQIELDLTIEESYPLHLHPLLNAVRKNLIGRMPPSHFS